MFIQQSRVCMTLRKREFRKHCRKKILVTLSPQRFQCLLHIYLSSVFANGLTAKQPAKNLSKFNTMQMTKSNLAEIKAFLFENTV